MSTLFEKKGRRSAALVFSKAEGAPAAVARGRGGGINQTKKKGKRRKEAQHRESPMPNGTKAETETQPYKTLILEERSKAAGGVARKCTRLCEDSLIDGYAVNYTK